MKKILFVSLLFLASLFFNGKVFAGSLPHAVNCNVSINNQQLPDSKTNAPEILPGTYDPDTDEGIYEIKACSQRFGEYAYQCSSRGASIQFALKGGTWHRVEAQWSSNNCLVATLKLKGKKVLRLGQLRVEIKDSNSSGCTDSGDARQLCQYTYFTLVNRDPNEYAECQNLKKTISGNNCSALTIQPNAVETNQQVNIKVNYDDRLINGPCNYFKYRTLRIADPDNPSKPIKTYNIAPGKNSFTFSPPVVGQYKVSLISTRMSGGSVIDSADCASFFCAAFSGQECTPKILPKDSNDAETTPYKICDQIPDDVPGPNNMSAKQACINCLGASGTDGIWTAVGCIKSDPTKITQALIRLGLGAAGGVALLSLLAGGFMFSVSEGDPKRVGQAKDLIVASLTGLLFIIFSVTLLQFIGWSILKIPGFGG